MNVCRYEFHQWEATQADRTYSCCNPLSPLSTSVDSGLSPMAKLLADAMPRYFSARMKDLSPSSPMPNNLPALAFQKQDTLVFVLQQFALMSGMI